MLTGREVAQTMHNLYWWLEGLKSVKGGKGLPGCTEAAISIVINEFQEKPDQEFLSTVDKMKRDARLTVNVEEGKTMVIESDGWPGRRKPPEHNLDIWKSEEGDD